MKLRQFFACPWSYLLLTAVMAVGCGSSSSSSGPVTDQPYETCYANDHCAGGLYCLPTTLSASSGATGYSCTSGCNYDSDCLQVQGSYGSFCVSGQCYLSCPAGNSACPVDQSCLSFSTSTGPISLCAP